MWGELSWGESSLGQDVCNSPRHGLYVNNLIFFMFISFPAILLFIAQ